MTVILFIVLSNYVWQRRHLQIVLPSTMLSASKIRRNRYLWVRESRVDILAGQHCSWRDNNVLTGADSWGYCHGAKFRKLVYSTMYLKANRVCCRLIVDEWNQGPTIILSKAGYFQEWYCHWLQILNSSGFWFKQSLLDIVCWMNRRTWIKHCKAILGEILRFQKTWTHFGQ